MPFIFIALLANCLCKEGEVMGDILTSIKEKAKANPKRIILPESTDERVLNAAASLIKEGIALPYLIGDKPTIDAKAHELGISTDGMEIRDPAHDQHMDVYIQELVKLRAHKGVNETKAKELLLDVKYFAAMMVHMGHADGCVTGATHPTSETIRPAVQIIGLKEGFSIASSYFLMLKDDETLFFADCAFVVNPSSAELADIALATHASARSFDIEPKIAMLSFSTRGSAQHEMVDKVAQATKLVKERSPNIAVDGELQFDAAYVPKVGESKCPNSPVGGHANVFIFPDLNAGNICYKVAQRLGGYSAIGPIIQGLNKPMNDLSRGCSVEDIINVVAITGVQTE